MLYVKCAYYVKLFLISVLSVLLFASVETAPEQPLLFLSITFVIIICIRLLWLSALRDEKVMKKRKLEIRQRNEPQHINKTNRAA